VSGRRLALIVMPVVLIAACGGAGGGETTTTGAALQGELLVSAAASLADVFAELGSDFEAAHPGVDVHLNLGSSASLRQQVLEGAPADVFASADTSNMAGVVDAGETTGDPVIFARNRMQIAVPAGNPARITGLDDLAKDELLIGLCAEQVPCGAYAREVLRNAGVTPSVDSDEPDVRALLTKVEAGELDAGITYLTDVISTGGGVEGLAIPEDVNVRADYPIATLAGAPNPEVAARFVAFVLSGQGQAILDGYGFSSP
jgi:molybdate transport system substrate-binding protein